MFKLKTVYSIFALLVFLLFNAAYLCHKAPYAFINVAFLMIAATGYFYKNVISYYLAALSWIILCPVFIMFYKISPFDASLPILIFNGLQFGFVRYKKMIEDDRKSWSLHIRGKEADKKKLQEEFGKFNAIEKEIKEKELAIVGLYEITKRMSEDLRFSDIFRVFSSFLQENFNFRKCSLLILNWENPEPRLDRVYNVWNRGNRDELIETVNYDKLIKPFSENPGKLYITAGENKELLKNLGIESKEVETFTGIPIISEGRPVAILALENLPREELEKFTILSMQFSLEIKKVLLYETVEKLAITDSLTGLYVRRYFSERLKEETQRSKRYNLKFAFIMIDIDDFKLTNDTYGHLVGDVILKELSRVITDNIREIDLACRYGGEEFALFLPETGSDGARSVAERIRKKIEESIFKAYNEKLNMKVSVGISIYPDDSNDAEDLIEKADAALYDAKKLGKNLVCEYKKRYNSKL